ncbi:MAG: hypothetical protein ACTSQY_00390 [Candidatus Odinarchaeia archaeon]|nr:MAG: hypothetical protein [Lokiarchaeota virus Fenrir Meg22_1012]URC17259.1 MAG: hypothetical protein [Lokiarchaeota virus Fenrir Meg22_1214]
MKKYKYRIVYPPEIIESKKNKLIVFRERRKDGITIRRENERYLEDFMNEVGEKGWELVSEIVYQGLPYGGGLIFKKEIKEENEQNKSNKTTTKTKKTKLAKNNKVKEEVADFLSEELMEE